MFLDTFAVGFVVRPPTVVGQFLLRKQKDLTDHFNLRFVQRMVKDKKLGETEMHPHAQELVCCVLRSDSYRALLEELSGIGMGLYSANITGMLHAQKVAE